MNGGSVTSGSPVCHAMTNKTEDIKQIVRDAAREVVLEMIAEHGYTVTPYAGAWMVRGAHFCVVFTCLESITQSQLRPNWLKDSFEDEEPEMVEELENLSFFGGEYDFA